MRSVSIVVCTRNRRELLARCLASLERQTVEEAEIVVIDNGSSDGTPADLAAWRRQGPNRVTVSEPVAGLSRARNRGLEAARGEVVLFLDDDALAPIAWAAAHVAAYEDDNVGAAGGPIVLAFPHGRPVWAVPELEHWWSALDHGGEPGPFPPPHGPYGANMSVRRARALEVGGFNPALGRVGSSLLSSEEADLFERLWATGATIQYLPAAIMIHLVTRERLSVRWLLRRGWAQGRSNVRRINPAQIGPLGARCTEEIRTAVRGCSSVLRDLGRGPAARGIAINDLSRRAGHLAMASELLWLRLRA